MNPHNKRSSPEEPRSPLSMDKSSHVEPPPPVGTLFLLGLYLAALAGMWLYMLFELIR